MYAAAGGASLASRQARQRQRQQKKTQLAQAKLHPPKASTLSVVEHGTTTPTRQSRQFHQLPTSYLRAPQSVGRKLSASYTTQSKLLLPIDEGDTQSVLQMRMPHGGLMSHSHHSHSHAHSHQHQHTYAHHQQQHQQHHHGRVSPKLVHRHSGSSGTSFHHSHLPKSATATLPLVSQVEATPPATPADAVGAKTSAAETPLEQLEAIAVPLHEGIIVTPATPMASPGHDVQLRDSYDLSETAAEKQPLTAPTPDGYDDDEPMQPPTGPLERKCSVYRMRRSDAFEFDEELGAAGSVRRQLKELQFNSHQQYEPLLIDEPQLVFKGLANGRKWQPCAYCEEGICVCEHIECAQGRAAWLERGRRCSVQESQAQAQVARRWVKRNRIQDASLGGSSDDEDFLGVLRGPSTFANAFLYVGLGTVALGLVIAFVGTGEKGFKTTELRLIGPSLIGLGLICCILRILFCICPSHCISSNKKTRMKNGNKIDADHTTSLLRGDSKRVSIARGPSLQPKYPLTHKRSNSKMLNEGMEALRQIATTSLFMQNEQKPSMNRVVPIIKEPEKPAEAPLEMKRLETALSVCEISDEEDEDEDKNIRKIKSATEATTTAPTTSGGPPKATATTATDMDEKAGAAINKLSRQRVALNQHQQPAEQSQSLSSSSTVKDSIEDDQLLMETSLMVATPSTQPSEARPPGLTSNTASRPTSAAPTTSRTSPFAAAIQPPPTYTGAISRASYDLPSALPHTYAAATARGGAERESLIRGPLGMPLSALTATVYPSSALAAKTQSPAKTLLSTVPTTTTVSLLPLPAPTTTTATSSALPGQVMDTTSLSIYKSAAGTATDVPPPPTIVTGSTNKTSMPATISGNSNFKLPASLPTTTTNGRATATLAPPVPPSVSKLEPELLLSPAKLGQ